MRDVRLRSRTLVVLFASFAIIVAALSAPVLSSSGGVGDQNLQWSNCSAHSVTSSAAIGMSVSKSSVAPGEQITAPANGQTVKGVIDVIATISAQGSATLRSVELKVDGKTVSVLSAEPFHWMLNTTQYADGSHTLTLAAIDSTGTSGTDQLFIDVANAPIDPLVVGGQAANSGLTGLDMIVVQILLVITLLGTLLHGRIRRK